MSTSAIYKAQPANQISTVGAATIFSLANNNTLAATVRVPGKLYLDGKRFFVRAEGSVYIGTAAGTAQPTLYGVTALPASPLVPGNWTLIGAATAQTFGSAAWVPWWIEANLIYDSNGGLMHGTFTSVAANKLTATAAITNPLTGINGTNVTVTQGGTPVPPADPVAWFAVSMNLVGAGSLANLANFEVGF